MPIWMDNVVLIHDNPTGMQTLLDITDATAKKYHIEFGQEKSKVMAIGPRKPTHELKLGDTTLEYTNKYKYLGETLNHKSNMEDQIKEIRKKTEAAFQTILTVAGDKDFKGANNMETSGHLHNTNNHLWIRNMGPLQKRNEPTKQHPR